MNTCKSCEICFTDGELCAWCYGEERLKSAPSLPDICEMRTFLAYCYETWKETERLSTLHHREVIRRL